MATVFFVLLVSADQNVFLSTSLKHLHTDEIGHFYKLLRQIFLCARKLMRFSLVLKVFLFLLFKFDIKIFR